MGFIDGPEAAVKGFQAEAGAGNTGYASAVRALRADFSDPDRDGPVRAAEFQAGNADDRDRVRQDTATVGNILLGNWSSQFRSPSGVPVSDSARRKPCNHAGSRKIEFRPGRGWAMLCRRESTAHHDEIRNSKVRTARRSRAAGAALSDHRRNGLVGGPRRRGRGLLAGFAPAGLFE